MKKCAVSGNSEQDEVITGQISSVWLLSSNTGSFVGSLAGARVFDVLGGQQLIILCVNKQTFIENIRPDGIINLLH